MLSRSHLAALVPLCALVGCATARPVSPPVVSSTPAVVTVGASEPAASLVGAEGARVTTMDDPRPSPLPGGAGAFTGATRDSLNARPDPLPEGEEMVPVAGVVSAALEAAALLTGSSGGTGPFWDELLTQSGPGLLIVKRAAQLVGISNLGRVSRAVPNDCSGLVRLAYLQAGIDLVAHGFLAGENAVSGIFRRALKVGSVHQLNPRPGDLVFFRETYDRNRDGKRNDGMTHIAVVERVDPDGTVTFIHRGGKGVARGRMNLSFPTTHRAASSGAVLNDYIRPASKGVRAYLAGELFAAFASPGGL